MTSAQIRSLLETQRAYYKTGVTIPVHFRIRQLKLAAKRIVFGKYLNCGQTCVAPDYILCENSIYGRFVAEVMAQIRNQYGANPWKIKITERLSMKNILPGCAV